MLPPSSPGWMGGRGAAPRHVSCQSCSSAFIHTYHVCMTRSPELKASQGSPQSGVLLFAHRVMTLLHTQPHAALVRQGEAGASDRPQSGVASNSLRCALSCRAWRRALSRALLLCCTLELQPRSGTPCRPAAPSPSQSLQPLAPASLLQAEAGARGAPQGATVPRRRLFPVGCAAQ